MYVQLRMMRRICLDSDRWTQCANISYNASYFFQISGEIAHLPTCRRDRLSVWRMARRSHAHGQRGLSCTAGVMLNVRRSDRNANQVSKLTLHSHRCTSDLQWFISQSESMCHCVECSWVNTALAKVHHLAAPPPIPRPPLPALDEEERSSRGPLIAHQLLKQVRHMKRIWASHLRVY